MMFIVLVTTGVIGTLRVEIQGLLSQLSPSLALEELALLLTGHYSRRASPIPHGTGT